LLYATLVAQPKRLPGISYDQLAVYFITTVTLNRVKVFTDHEFAQFVVDALVAIAKRLGFQISAYVVMPDHVHFVATAEEEGADLERLVKDWKQKTGFEWKKKHKYRLWQKGYIDRVLRAEEHTLSVCRYVLENPVRAKLAAHPSDYPLCGSTQYTIEEICEAIHIRGWWNPY
jgi:REP-associated tyrosine transposase